MVDLVVIAFQTEAAPVTYRYHMMDLAIGSSWTTVKPDTINGGTIDDPAILTEIKEDLIKNSILK